MCFPSRQDQIFNLRQSIALSNTSMLKDRGHGSRSAINQIEAWLMVVEKEVTEYEVDISLSLSVYSYFVIINDSCHQAFFSSSTPSRHYQSLLSSSHFHGIIPPLKSPPTTSPPQMTSPPNIIWPRRLLLPKKRPP